VSDDNSDSSLKGPLAEHFSAERNRLDAFERGCRDVRCRVAILGPGDGGEGFEKRCQIRDVLNSESRTTAFFPEQAGDLETYICDRYLLDPDDVDVIEGLMFVVSDIVIILERSAGSREEAAIYSRNPHLASKIDSLLPDRLQRHERDTFPGKIRRTVRRHYYSEEDFRVCRLATVISPAIVRRRQVERRLFGY